MSAAPAGVSTSGASDAECAPRPFREPARGPDAADPLERARGRGQREARGDHRQRRAAPHGQREEGQHKRRQRGRELRAAVGQPGSFQRRGQHLERDARDDLSPRGHQRHERPVGRALGRRARGRHGSAHPLAPGLPAHAGIDTGAEVTAERAGRRLGGERHLRQQHVRCARGAARDHEPQHEAAPERDHRRRRRELGAERLALVRREPHARTGPGDDRRQVRAEEDESRVGTERGALGVEPAGDLGVEGAAPSAGWRRPPRPAPPSCARPPAPRWRGARRERDGGRSPTVRRGRRPRRAARRGAALGRVPGPRRAPRRRARPRPATSAPTAAPGARESAARRAVDANASGSPSRTANGAARRRSFIASG